MSTKNKQVDKLKDVLPSGEHIPARKYSFFSGDFSLDTNQFFRQLFATCYSKFSVYSLGFVFFFFFTSWFYEKENNLKENTSYYSTTNTGLANLAKSPTLFKKSSNIPVNGTSKKRNKSTPAFSTNSKATANNRAAGPGNNYPFAGDDEEDLVLGGSTITTGNVLSNDIDLDFESVSIIDFEQPVHGTVIYNNDGTFDYSSTGAHVADSFDYLIIDTGSDLTHHWGLNGNGTDGVGSSDATINGTTTVSGAFGTALSFNETISDYVQVPDFAYNNEFTISFDFKIDDNTGSLFQYIYSHGSSNNTNSINIFLNEASHGTDPNVLRTVLRDNDDALSNTALEFNISSLINDGNWHNYTLVVSSANAQIFIDGGFVSASSTVYGGDNIDPAGDLYLGTKEDLDVNRLFGGSLDNVQVYDWPLSVFEMSSKSGESNRGTVILDFDFPAICDTIETATISFDTAGMNTNSGYVTIFVLADSAGVITDTSSTPQFNNVSAGKYLVLALDYVDDASLANFAVGDSIQEATANCLEWSQALAYRICPAEICNNGIDDDEDGDTDCDDSDCPNPLATATSSGPICEGENLLLDETGGEGVAWNWSGPSGASSNSKSFGLGNVDSGNAGTYSVTVTGPNGCTTVSTVVVVVNAEPTATVGSNSPICDGADLNLTESGGDAVSWSWSGPNSFTSTDQNPTIVGATSAAAGTYNITITDANSCTTTSSTTVTLNASTTADASSNSGICVGDDINLSEIGGDAVSWSWSGPNSFTSTNQNPTISSSTIAADGIYTVTVTDANTCTATATVDVTVNPAPTIQSQVTGNPSSCGGNDGTITVVAADGTGNFEYNIDGGVWGSSGAFTGLSAASYIVGIRNDNGTCEITTGSITLSDPSSPTAEITLPASACQGVATSFTATDAGVGATYTWDFGTDATPATATGIGPHSVTYSSGGSKTIGLDVTLAGCTASDSESYTIFDAPSVTMTPPDSTICANSSNITFTASAGYPNYNWMVIAGDATPVSSPTPNSLEVSVGTTNFTIGVVVTDANGCTNTTQTAITLSPVPTTVAGSNSPVCAGDDIDLTETGGDAVSWSWTGPNGFTSSAKDTTITNATATEAGTYTVVTTDAGGCTNSATVNVVVNPTPTATANSNAPLCIGDDINLTETGGDGVSWSWTGPDGFTSTNQNPSILSATIAKGGQYRVTITDAASCTAIDSVTVALNTLPTAIVNSNSPVCEGDSLKLTEDGVNGVSWSWAGPNGFTSTEENPNIENVSTLADGTYNVTVTGSNNCTATGTIAITIFATPTITGVTPTNPSACAASDGSITVAANPGTGSVEYRINGGAWQSSGSFTGLSSGSYIIEIQNDNGFCIVANGSPVVLSDPASPTADINMPSPVCQDVATSFLAINAGPGATYSWDFGTDASPATATGAGPHSVTYSSSGSKAISLEVTSTVGCVATDAESYTVYSLPNVTLTLNQTEACVDEASFTLSGGTPTGGTFSGPGVSGGNFDPATAGVGVHTITYTYTDPNGCVNTATDDIEVYALPVVTLTLTDDDACVDGGRFVLGGGSPGTGLYSGTGVEGDGLTFDPAVAGVGVHTITYTVTDPNGCVNTATDDLEVYALPVVTLSLTDDEACEDDGTLTLGGGSPSGAGGVFSGPHVTGPTTFDVAAAGVGIHTVTYTYTDANGCINSATDDIEVYTLPTPTLVLGINEACVSETVVALSGGSPSGGTFSGTGVSGSNFNPSVAGVGTHTVTYTYTDGNGCINTTTDDFGVIALPVVSLVLGDDIACEDEATVTLSGGSPSGGTYSGPFVTGPTTFDVAGAGAGTHTITYTYTDANGCTNTATDDIIIYTFPSVASAVPTHPATCGVDDGTITITGAGGSGSYEYRINGGSWQSSNVFSGLSAGDYDVDIRNDNGTCIASFVSNPVVVNQPPGATISANVVVISDYNGEDISCNGLSDASARVTAINGSPPYSYLWSNAQTGTDLVNVAAGTYFVTVTDNTNCVTVASIDITEPDEITAGAIVTNVSCFGGSDGEIDLNVSGGVNAFTYGWDDLSTEAFYNFDNTTDDQTGNGHDDTGIEGSSFSSPGIEQYSTDAFFGSASFDFNGNTKIKYDDGSDFLESDFSELTIQVWIKPDLTGDKIIFEEGGPQYGGIALGMRDEFLNGAVAQSNNVQLAVPMAIPNDGQWHHVGLVYNNGDLTLFIDGVMGTTTNTGITSLNHSAIAPWNRGGIGGTFSTNAFDVPGNLFYEGLMDNFSYHREALTIEAVEDSFDDDGDREGLTAGDYDVLITDLNGCNISITVTVTEPPELILDTIPTEVSCFGGSDGELDLVVTGGTTPYTYSWSNSATTQDLTGLSQGVYSVTVTDDNGCTKTIESTIIQPPLLTANAVVNSSGYGGQDVSCPGATDGSVRAEANFGRPPYSYLWDTGDNTIVVNGLGAGTYTVTVTDDNGCTEDASVTLVDPTPLNVNATIDIFYGTGNVTCVGATDGGASAAPAVGSGGVAPFSYDWDNGDSGSSITNIGVGTYVVTMTDQNGCTATSSVTLVNPPAINPNLSITSDYNGEDVSCPGAADGSVYTNPTGGGGDYRFAWQHDSGLSDLTDSLVNIVAGTYRVTVTDVYGCTAVESITLNNPPPVTASITVNSSYSGVEISCEGGTDGDITAIPSGGVGSFAYQWDRDGTGLPNTTANISNAGAGTYNVTVTDANGCTAVASTTLTEPPPLDFTFLTAAPTDCGNADGIIVIFASGGTGGYEYSLDGGPWQSAPNFIGLPPGTYNARVRNTFGTCVAGPTAITVEVAEAPIISGVTIIHPTTNVSTDGAIKVVANGTLAIERRIVGVTGWQTGEVFSNLPVGTYTIEVRYIGQNCITTQTVTLTAGAGVESTGSALSFCSGDVSATQFVETYYIPGPESQMLDGFESIFNTTDCFATPSAPVNPITTYISIGVVESGTIIHYDHWEDGYEPNLTFPLPTTSTEIWGDNDPTNGIPPGYAVDYLTAADIIVLSNEVDVVVQGSGSPATLYDGRDIIGSRGNLAVTRLAWADGSKTLLAGALEVYPQESWGTDYTIPVGVNADVNGMFSYTGAVVMAREDGTTVNYVDNGVASTTTLNKGESLHIDGNINAGDDVTASAPVQVHLLTGSICSTFSSRFFTLKPTEQWSADYYNPVATLNDGSGTSTSGVNRPTFVHLFNPNASAITVSWETNAGTQTNIIVPANGTAVQSIPDGTGTHFFTPDDRPFYAIATVDSDGGVNTANDWGYALLPGNQLSPQITMVGFAPGANPEDLEKCCDSVFPTIFSADSEDVTSGEVASNAVDGDVNTIWQTQYNGGTPPYPHSIEFDLGLVNTFTGFRYTPRQDGPSTGTIAGYELHFWNGAGYTLIASGTWANNTDIKSISFTPVTARYVRLTALSEINGGATASAAELAVLRPENSAPIWITADYPPGSSSSGNITICVDHDGDGGTIFDANGIGYDESIILAELGNAKVYDPDDNDQTG
ncbi:MAG: LamG-like jellyroll fold domain-containing protein, partial [Saprospiraceae bacterium]